MTSSQSAPGDLGCVAERYARAIERFRTLATATSCTSPTPNSSGPQGPGGGASSLFDVIERSLGYGIEPPSSPEGYDAPPLVTYETTPGPYGDVVRATNAYVTWFRRTYCVEGGEDRIGRAGISSPIKEVGGEDSGALASGGRYKQNDLAP